MSQSNLISPYKGTYSVTAFELFSALFLASCTSAPKKSVVTVPAIESNIIDPEVDMTITAEETIALASDQNPTEAKKFLIKATQLYLEQEYNSKALWLADKLLSLEVSEQERYDLSLIKAQALQNLGYSELALESLTNIEETYPQLYLTELFYQTSVTVYLSLDKEILALNANLYADELNFKNYNIADLTDITELTDDERTLLLEKITQFWQQIERLPSWKLNSLKSYNAPQVNGWVALLSKIKTDPPASLELHNNLIQWSAKYPNHPAILIIPTLEQSREVVPSQPRLPTLIDKEQTSSKMVEETPKKSTTIINHAANNNKNDFTNDVNDASKFENAFEANQQLLADTSNPLVPTTSNKFNNIAVLLPLSGSQSVAGNTILQGILTAYHNNSSKKLHFYDTSSLDWAMLNERFIKDEIDFTIGPILKSNVQKLQLLTGNDLPGLLLNVPSKEKLKTNQYAFSMLPEEEAKQSAWVLSEQEYVNPIVLSHDDTVSRRIAKAFSKMWTKRTGIAVKIHYFSQGKAMQDSLQKGFDVNASENRIKQIERLNSSPVKSEKRNRRDVDMIYLVGTTAQTKLVKPFIDVNTSRFSKQIPVFASSRSHDGDDDNSTNNDLNGLVFTEAPLLLPAKQQDKKLSALNKQLYPNRNGRLSRLYAMGFDSYNLIDLISSMVDAPYLRYDGQTGTLRLNDNVLSRTLLWGQYQRNGVAAINPN